MPSVTALRVSYRTDNSMCRLATAGFIETIEEQATWTGLSVGTWLDIGFEFPPARCGSPDRTGTGSLQSLDPYKEAVHPYIEQMDFVAMYWLPWLDASGPS
jgi:hypothetical protein